ncbi:MAG: HPt (histidine-containing phosphotransfer) domain-containing protein [Hyphomicrobiaceae bacterium]|jgi:HPt (histidine-containing phosphotransfer) domain-containing protein
MEASRLELLIGAYVSSMRARRDFVAGRLLVKDWSALLLVARRLRSTSVVYGLFDLGDAASACENAIQAGEVEAEITTLAGRLVYDMGEVILGRRQ